MIASLLAYSGIRSVLTDVKDAKAGIFSWNINAAALAAPASLTAVANHVDAVLAQMGFTANAPELVLRADRFRVSVHAVENGVTTVADLLTFQDNIYLEHTRGTITMRQNLGPHLGALLPVRTDVEAAPAGPVSRTRAYLPEACWAEFTPGSWEIDLNTDGFNLCVRNATALAAGSRLRIEIYGAVYRKNHDAPRPIDLPNDMKGAIRLRMLEFASKRPDIFGNRDVPEGQGKGRSR